VPIFLAAKFNLGELYERVGFAKEYISKGKYAELDADQRPFRYSITIFYVFLQILVFFSMLNSACNA